MTGLFDGLPTICDLNCFYSPGHDGPHQAWNGDPCSGCGYPMSSAVKHADGWYHLGCAPPAADGGESCP